MSGAGRVSMSSTPKGRGRIAILCAAALAIGLGVQASASNSPAPVVAKNTIDWMARSESGGLPGHDPGLTDLDNRGPRLSPSVAALADLHSIKTETTISWNQFGTPQTLVPATFDGWLATGIKGDAVTVARAFLRQHADLMGLAPAQVGQLELVNDAKLGDKGHAVLLRQRVGGLAVAQDGLVAVGVREGKVASVTSSLVPTKDTQLFGQLNTTTAKLTPARAFLKAAAEVGLTKLKLDDIMLMKTFKQGDFVTMAVKGLAQPGLARLRALPTSDSGFRLVYETDVQNTVDGGALAYISMVDAVTGKVLLRHNAVDQLTDERGSASAQRNWSDPTGAATVVATNIYNQVGSAQKAPAFGGVINASYSADACGDAVPLAIPAGTVEIQIQSNELNPANDVVVKVIRGNKEIVSDDLLVANELTTASLDPAAAAGEKFSVKYCPLDASTVPQLGLPPFQVIGVYTTNDTGGSGPASPVAFPAKWSYFESNPALPGTPKVDVDQRITACWNGQSNNPSVSKPVNDCQRQVSNVYSRLAWDILPNSGTPSFTTLGNNAKTAMAWVSPLTPGENVSPISQSRDYTFPWTNQWLKERCNPSVFASPQRNDIDANTVNLFTGHNRIHDYSYRLGFSEKNYNMQQFNFGETATEYQNDYEIGNVQAGAVTGAPGATGLGRDNANQITLQDGVAGITNQYLFQPVAGFWAPCVDGDLDGLIFGHEYTHATSNRMIAGPDTGLGGVQGGAMGESWSDLVATEYLNATGVAGLTGADPYSAGAYATNNKISAIRDYNLLQNPLMYGDIGFDTTGPEVHADGEIWNGVQMHVRQALINAYNAKGIKASDKLLQLSCAFGTDYKKKGVPASGFEGCPGNRRWIQYIFDAWLLQANGSPSFVDMKNSMLAADKIRTGGVDSAVMATAFAQRGLGKSAFSPVTNDGEMPDFASLVSSTNSKVQFKVVDSGTGKLVASTIWVGRFHARTTPYVTTKAGGTGSAVFTKGNYEFIVRALGYGLTRASATITPGKANVVTIKVDPNYAAISRGASIKGDGVRLNNMIDEDEGTNGGFNGLTSATFTVPDPSGLGLIPSVGGDATGTAIAGKSWTVKLAGGKKLVKRLNLSTLHHPVSGNAEDGDFQGRTKGLRAFNVMASSDGGKTYKLVYSSPNNAFPAGYPRPVAPDLIIRSFVLPKPVSADHIKIVVRTNQCTGSPDYQGDQDDDPTNNSDCALTDSAYQVILSEIEVFGSTVATATARPVRA